MHETHAEPAEIAGLEWKVHMLAVELQSAARVGRVKSREDLDQG